MGKQIAKVAGQAPLQERFRMERLFMKNGSVFTIQFVEKRLNAVGDRTEYLGAKGVFLGEVLEDAIAARVSGDVPFEVREVPANDQPGAPLVRREIPTAGQFIVSGYKI